MSPKILTKEFHEVTRTGFPTGPRVDCPTNEAVVRPERFVTTAFRGLSFTYTPGRA